MTHALKACKTDVLFFRISLLTSTRSSCPEVFSKNPTLQGEDCVRALLLLIDKLKLCNFAIVGLRHRYLGIYMRTTANSCFCTPSNKIIFYRVLSLCNYLPNMLYRISRLKAFHCYSKFLHLFWSISFSLQT